MIYRTNLVADYHSFFHTLLSVRPTVRKLEAVLTTAVGAPSSNSDHHGSYDSLHLRLQISPNLAMDIQSHLPHSRW
jgi:hypothetical protein